MKRNVSGQHVAAQLIAKADGSNVTAGTTSVTVTGDGGIQTAGAGVVTHKGGGQWDYEPTQGETDFAHVAFQFSNAAAVTALAQAFPSFPQTGDSFARLGAPVGASISADLASVKTQAAAIEVDTQDLQSRVPASLVGGRIDASVGAMAADVVTAAALAADALDEVGDAVWTEQIGDHSGVAGSAAAVLEQAWSVIGEVVVVTDKLNETLEDDLGVHRFTTNALEQGPTGGGGLDAAGVRAAVGLASANLDTQLGAIVADTSELQVDWANGGRLDVILDARASQTSVDDRASQASLDALAAVAGDIDAKTTNLPPDPADASVVGASLTGIADKVNDLHAHAERTVLRGTVGVGATVTSLVTSAFAPAGAAADQFKGRIVLFDAATATAALRGQGGPILASSVAAEPVITLADPLTTAPASGDTFSVL